VGCSERTTAFDVDDEYRRDARSEGEGKVDEIAIEKVDLGCSAGTLSDHPVVVESQ